MKHITKMQKKEEFHMAKTLKKVMAVLLAGLVTATAPVNVSAAAASEDGHVVFGGYGLGL